MKIKIEVEVDLYDWKTQNKMFLREHVGDLDGGKGRKFKISRPVGGINLQVQQDGTQREAMANLAPLVKAMAEAIVTHAKKIDAEKKAA
jgi:hypothetical protein